NYLTDPTDTGTGTGQHMIINLEKGAGTLEVRIVGINHDEKVGGGKAGLTFMATHRLPDKYNQKMHLTENISTNGWRGSPIRADLSEPNGKVWKLMPPELVTAIEPVNKYTNNAGGGPGTEYYPVTPPTQEKLWIPSYAELVPSVFYGWTSWKWAAQEGSQYPFFTKWNIDYWGGNGILASMCFDYPGLASKSGAWPWWNRSCHPPYGDHFVVCNTDGNPSNGFPAAIADSGGIVLGFSL
ncbi:MAG: DUF6273 domain-containing protein, partial [Raoultibacter sp.]